MVEKIIIDALRTESRYIYGSDGREIFLKEKIAIGGTGVVWKGFYTTDNTGQKLSANLQLANPVAVKQIQNLKPLAVQKFLEEAAALSALKAHPNIVKVYDLFKYPLDYSEREMPSVYLVMEYCFQTLEDIKLNKNEAEYCLLQICRGLEYIHGQGILHRDLKLDNILLSFDKAGQVVAKIADFGQSFVPVKLGGNGYDIQGSMWCTAPEVLRDEIGPHFEDGVRADIFSLGTLAYKLLAGQHYLPFSKDRDADYLLITNRSLEITPLSNIPGIKLPIPPLLENMVMKALKLNPNERYQSVTEMIKDLEILIYGKRYPLEQAWKDRKFEQLAPRWFEHKVSVLAVSQISNLVALGEDKVIKVVRFDADYNHAEIAHEFGGLHPEKGAVSVAFSNGVVSQAQNSQSAMLIAVSSHNTIKIWEALSGKLVHTLHHHKGLIPTIDNLYRVNSVRFSFDNRLIASCANDHTIKLWDYQSGELIRTINAHKAAIGTLDFSSNSQLLASGSDDTTVKIWEASTGKLQSTFTQHKGWVRAVKFSPDGNLLVTASYDGTLQVWTVKTCQLLHTLKGHEGWVTSVAIDAYGEVVASSSADKTVKIWSLRTGELLGTLGGHAKGVSELFFSPNGKILFTSSPDQSMRRWRIVESD
jgi:WD40 repeat protein